MVKYIAYPALVVAYIVLFLCMQNVTDKHKAEIGQIKQEISKVNREVYRQSEWINGIDYIYVTEVVE